ncbi:copper homeostasis periplasmic binding protein CopC [Luteibacter sp. 9135]|uniref:copper homeostasis periplasmic binding protein CopC n=1 Tax=Luteibacter sp. 9135 TaxID=1500893 RepID=UPI000561B867|nr:copper homeostasis periplasmic binding protein CopC [Luteibacter sp. 9135]
MPTFRRLAVTWLGLAAFLLSGSALAHPKLISSTPADKAVGAAPRSIQLTFSEALMPQFSAADVMITAMPGMAMAPAKVATAVATGTDGQTLVVTPTRPLTRGSYRVDWHVVSVDTHAVKGSFTFEVK